jgi:hypothetical protein
MIREREGSLFLIIISPGRDVFKLMMELHGVSFLL